MVTCLSPSSGLTVTDLVVVSPAAKVRDVALRISRCAGESLVIFTVVISFGGRERDTVSSWTPEPSSICPGPVMIIGGLVPAVIVMVRTMSPSVTGMD